MFFGRRQDAQSRSVGGISSSLDIELFPKPANILWLMIYDRKHAAKEEQITRLYRLDVSAKRRWGFRELNSKVLQPAICTAQLLGTFTAYHRPTCAPPSTCSTSPVTFWASVT